MSRFLSHDIKLTLLLLLALPLAGCARHVLLPPRMELGALLPIGIVEFRTSGDNANLGRVATNHFMAALFEGQSRMEFVELGPEIDVLDRIGSAGLDSEAYSDIGRIYGVPAVFVGVLDVAPVRPRGEIFHGPRLEAVVSVELTVRLVSTEDGVTLWTRSNRGEGTVGELGLARGELVLGAENPNGAYKDLVELLAYDITADFRPYYARR